MKMQARRKGFSLIETLFVISILTILLSLLASGVSAIRASMTKIECANHLRQIGIAAHAYHGVHGKLPPSSYLLSVNYPATWCGLLLPFLEQESLWLKSLDAYRTGAFMTQIPPHIGLATVVKQFTCPGDGRLGLPITDDHGFTAAYGSFSGIAGVGHEFQSDFFKRRGAMRADGEVAITEILDGTGNTLLIGESPPRGRYLSGNWYTNGVDEKMRQVPSFWPLARSGKSSLYMVFDSRECSGRILFGPGRLDNECDQLHFWSLHKGGANFLFADGAVRFIPYQARDIMPALATIAGGESVELPH